MQQKQAQAVISRDINPSPIVLTADALHTVKLFLRVSLCGSNPDAYTIYFLHPLIFILFVLFLPFPVMYTSS